ncbi:site-2 protease family protein, partial [Candidatus Fermentibacteria bacterium]|nr:site-2 protease family protein [Candidatus Fermentibacteria bacterium]
LSVNLAIINLAPVPPLDGGSIVMSVLQRVYRPLGRLRLPLALAGWGALGLLFLYTTVMDVYRLV